MSQLSPEVLAIAKAIAEAQQNGHQPPAKRKKASKKANARKQDPALTGLYWFVALILAAWIINSTIQIVGNAKALI